MPTNSIGNPKVEAPTGSFKYGVGRLLGQQIRFSQEDEEMSPTKCHEGLMIRPTVKAHTKLRVDELSDFMLQTSPSSLPR